MANNLIYIGDDVGYLETLKKRFATYPALQLNYFSYFAKDEAGIQTIFHKVLEKNPKLVYIDFSKNEKEFLHLARILNRVKDHFGFQTIGLIDLRSPVYLRSEAALTGNTLNHIKCGEYHDVVYDAVYLMAPEQAGELKMARANLKEEVVTA